MPVYNEEKLIEGVVSGWQREMSRLPIHYEFLLYDDGSKDNTRAILERISQGSPELTAKTQSNRGHGPTVLRGYAESKGEWILQIDSDGEIEPSEFAQLWASRDSQDLVLGCRQNRQESALRRSISWSCRTVVRLLFGRGIDDVNTPFRLIRRARLARILSRIPSDTFAPNVIISGLALRNKWRISQCRVPHRGRKAGVGSLAGLRIWRAVLRSFCQTVKAAFIAEETR